MKRRDSNWHACTYIAGIIIYEAAAATTGPELQAFDKEMTFIKDTEIRGQ